MYRDSPQEYMKSRQQPTDKKISYTQRGFTLVELLVVIAIIGVLATLLVLQLNIARARARDIKRVADISQVRSALEFFFDDNGRYPAQTDMSPLLADNYLAIIPVDPLATGCTSSYNGTVVGALNCYGYAWNPSNASNFHIWTELEYSNGALRSDMDIDSTGWSGAAIEGSDEVDCANDTPQDCIFDVGSNL